MILLNRLEKFAAQIGYFSELQFGFSEGVGCTEASFTILETIDHMLEPGSKVFTCFLDVWKAFDTVWIGGLLFRLFSDLGINGRMWLALKDLYTDIKARVFYLQVLFHESSIFPRVQARADYLLHLCMKSILIVFLRHYQNTAVSINNLSLPSLMK